MGIPGAANPLLLQSAAAAPAAGDTRHGLRFNNTDDTNLTRTFSSAGNKKTWTVSFWMKVAGPQESSYGSDFWGAYYGNNARYISLRVKNDGRFALYGGAYTTGGSSSVIIDVATKRTLRDYAGWIHCVVSVDTTQGTDTKRVKFWFNGVQETSLGNWGAASNSPTYPSQNDESFIGADLLHFLGCQPNVWAGYTLDGYLCDFYYIDGQQLAPSVFAETDSTTNQWVPISSPSFSSTPAGNSVHFKWDNSSSLGEDGFDLADWTPGNFSTTAGTGNDLLFDSAYSSGTDAGAGGEVLGTYATWDPLATGCTLTQGNLNASSGANKRVTSNFPLISGKWYWEVTLTNSTIQQFGLGSLATAYITSGSPPGDSGHNSYIALTNGQYYHNGSMTGSGLATTTTNDVLGFAFDADSRKFWISKNGSWQGSGSPNPATGTDPLWTVSADYAPYSPVVGAGGADAVNCALNAGQRAFADSAPSGFKCLCTNNLAEPAILKPNLHFGIDLYTGTGSSRSITSFDFDPDFVWIKKRNATEHHIAFDQVRGTEESIWPRGNYQEDSWSGEGISAWLSNGWTIGDSNNANENNDTYATWNWEADTTASGTWGANSKAYSRRANSTAGFSIIKWVGDASTGIPGTGAIPHGLSGAPDLLIQKRLDAAGDWWVGFNCIDGSFDYMRLNEQTAKGDEGYDLWDADEISNWGAGINHDFIAYVFKNIPGFSKVGYYVGNSSADGTQVILDFRPRFLIIKSLDLAFDWHLIDTARNPFNGTSSLRLKPNSNAQEVTGSHNVVDLNCNGFKLRHSDNNWNSGHKFLYWAIADSPFKYARAG